MNYIERLKRHVKKGTVPGYSVFKRGDEYTIKMRPCKEDRENGVRAYLTFVSQIGKDYDGIYYYDIAHGEDCGRGYYGRSVTKRLPKEFGELFKGIVRREVIETIRLSRL